MCSASLPAEFAAPALPCGVSAAWLKLISTDCWVGTPLVCQTPPNPISWGQEELRRGRGTSPGDGSSARPAQAHSLLRAPIP